MTPPVVLSIAGSDSGGGAGIQADLRTYAALGVHGATAITALTAQNTTEVRGILATPTAFLREQIAAVLDDFRVAATKTGMLATVDNVRAVAELAGGGRLPNLVVDPVLVSSSGHRLFEPDAERAYVEDLFPHALVITPNSREAAALLDVDVPRTVDGQRELARALAAEVPTPYVVVKGGDAGGDGSVDVIAHAGELTELSAPRIATANNHGTGCSFASAIAAYLACGEEPLDAIAGAKAFVTAAIERAVAWRLGAGHGPIAHLDLDSIRNDAHPTARPDQGKTP